MNDERQDMPSWMLCQEILVKAKNELILEAIDALHRETEAKRIDIKGSTVKIEGKNSEIDRDMFIINNLLAQEDDMRIRYAESIKSVEEGHEKNPAIVERINELKKFFLSVTEIHMAMKYARIFDQWVLDVGSAADLDDPARILAETAKKNADRIDALEFVLEDKAFIKNEGLSKEEFKITEDAFFLCKSG